MARCYYKKPMRTREKKVMECQESVLLCKVKQPNVVFHIGNLLKYALWWRQQENDCQNVLTEIVFMLFYLAFKILRPVFEKYRYFKEYLFSSTFVCVARIFLSWDNGFTKRAYFFSAVVINSILLWYLFLQLTSETINLISLKDSQNLLKTTEGCLTILVN